VSTKKLKAASKRQPFLFAEVNKKKDVFLFFEKCGCFYVQTASIFFEIRSIV
jgi:hypothetical protein